ncbi:hypothetical protein [Kribbella sp. NBC_00889]|nr:hypothetical protein OG817_24535 [Kribbella sp. NBC_00889]
MNRSLDLGSAGIDDYERREPSCDRNDLSNARYIDPPMQQFLPKLV